MNKREWIEDNEYKRMNKSRMNEREWIKENE